MDIHMTINERKLFLNTVTQKGGSYFEFGAGGSTVAASSIPSITEVVSIESDQNWINKVQKLAPKIKMIYVNIGPTGEWGMPLNQSKIKNWHKYSTAIDEYSPDMVLVDGRFRVACICRAILALKAEGLILVHDFWDRPHYHVVLPFLEVQAKADRLAVFKVKKDISTEKVVELWRAYMHYFR